MVSALIDSRSLGPDCLSSRVRAGPLSRRLQANPYHRPTVVTTAEAWKIIRRAGGERSDEEIKANQAGRFTGGRGCIAAGGKLYVLTLRETSFWVAGIATKETDHQRGCRALAADGHIDQAPMIAQTSGCPTH
jgi:hypothetical protein